MSFNRALSDQAFNKWGEKITKKFPQAKNISEKRLRSICEMAHARKIAESLDGIPGRGGVAFGNNPNAGHAGSYASTGSSEVWNSLFNVFLEVAATNVGMDLVPMIPQLKSSGIYHVVEPIYAGGKIGSTKNRPEVFQVKLTKTGTPPVLAVGTSYNVKESNTGDTIMSLVYVGANRMNGYGIFRFGAAVDNSGSSGTDYTAVNIADSLAVSGAGIYASAGNFIGFDGGVDYVPGLQNVISGYAGAGINDTDAFFMNRSASSHYNQGTARGVGELSTGREMGLRRWHKNFAAETVKLAMNYTIEEMQDMRMDLGMEATEYGDIILKNELDQAINGHILGRMFALGWSHHYAMNKANGFNMNAFIAASGSTSSAKTYLGKDNSQLTIAGSPGVLPATGAISENLSTLQRRILSRMLYGSGIINVRSRRGRGDQAVMNTTFASAIKDVRGFASAPTDNTIDQTTGLAKIGKMLGMDIYEDPLMDLSDERINISRHGSDKDPGIKFLPYLLAEKIRTIPADTMGTKDVLISRYNVLDAGSIPETNYLTFSVQTTDGYAII